MDSTPLKEYLQAAIAAADKGKLSALMASFGYRSFQTITPSMLMNALDTYGRDFSIPFGRLVRYSLDSRSSADGSRSAYSCDWTEAYTTVTDFLINGAGGNNPRATTDNETAAEAAQKDFFALDESGIKFVFDLNITTAFLVTQVFAEDMLETGGNIINISSMNAYRPLTKIPAYSAAKAGISNFTQWLAVHFASKGIRCNAIAPGFFVTNQNRDLLFNKDGTPTARTGKILAATPMKKFGEVSDLLGALLWLADDNASGFVTGTVIPVDGGFSAYSGV